MKNEKCWLVASEFQNTINSNFLRANKIWWCNHLFTTSFSYMTCSCWVKIDDINDLNDTFLNLIKKRDNCIIDPKWNLFHFSKCKFFLPLVCMCHHWQNYRNNFIMQVYWTLASLVPLLLVLQLLLFDFF